MEGKRRGGSRVHVFQRYSKATQAIPRNGPTKISIPLSCSGRSCNLRQGSIKNHGKTRVTIQIKNTATEYKTYAVAGTILHTNARQPLAHDTLKFIRPSSMFVQRLFSSRHIPVLVLQHPWTVSRSY